jgi:hypothetical protein
LGRVWSSRTPRASAFVMRSRVRPRFCLFRPIRTRGVAALEMPLHLVPYQGPYPPYLVLETYAMPHVSDSTSFSNSMLSYLVKGKLPNKLTPYLYTYHRVQNSSKCQLPKSDISTPEYSIQLSYLRLEYMKQYSVPKFYQPLNFQEG